MPDWARVLAAGVTAEPTNENPQKRMFVGASPAAQPTASKVNAEPDNAGKRQESKDTDCEAEPKTACSVRGGWGTALGGMALEGEWWTPNEPKLGDRETGARLRGGAAGGVASGSRDAVERFAAARG